MFIPDHLASLKTVKEPLDTEGPLLFLDKFTGQVDPAVFHGVPTIPDLSMFIIMSSASASIFAGVGFKQKMGSKVDFQK